ncbi:hypothetical protein Cgig2_023725 [Carnegiea gigantea]|uniref:Uncharacterized protein n=1 Tax=Carnegiea gigantea TaxID=171969 RepID=A0A9Q1KL53_9CARY|nr:hypothetical protein Cgig2_023725 [Carnegiea gigantea]
MEETSFLAFLVPRSTFFIFSVLILIPIPKDNTTNQNPKKQSLIKTEPVFFDDDEEHDESVLKKAKINHHENLAVINAEPVGWSDPPASTPIYHFDPVDPGLVLWNFITITSGGKKIKLIIEKSLEKTDLDELKFLFLPSPTPRYLAICTHNLTMAQEQGNKTVCLLGVHVQFLRLFGVHIPIPTNQNPKKRSLIKTEPIFFDDDDHEYQSRELLKRQKTNHHENLGVINAEPVGWLHPAASTSVYHSVPVDHGLVIWNFITTTLGGKKIELIIEKSLEKTDLDGHQARLSMPKSHILREFLTKQEEDLLEDKQKVPVMVIDPCLRTFELKLTKWKYHKIPNKNANNEGHSDGQSRRRCSYMLISGWNKLREANSSSLTVSAMIQVWSFRVQDKLGLAIIKI